MEDTARRVRELQAEAESTAENVAQSKKERVRVTMQLRKQRRTMEVWDGIRVRASCRELTNSICCSVVLTLSTRTRLN